MPVPVGTGHPLPPGYARLHVWDFQPFYLSKIMKLFILLLAASVSLTACKPPSTGDERKLQFYQSPMHPWIKSDTPGQCTICGMALVPVYAGEAGFDTGGDTLMLSDATIQVINVATATVERGSATRTLRLAGTIEDDAGRHRVVSAHFDGRIEKPFIEQVGEEVREGQPLAEIYSPELLYVAREFQRASIGRDRNAAESAGRRLIQYGLTPDQLGSIATQPADKFGIDLLSPMTGTVIKRYVNAGQYVKTGDPLFELGDFSRMWFEAVIYENDFPLVHLGQKAIVTTPAAPGEEFEGIVTLVDPNFDPMTRSTQLRIEVPNPMVRTSRGERRALPHGGYAEAKIDTIVGEGLVVPRSAVLDTGLRTIAYVEKSDGAYERRDIRLGGRGDTQVLIRSGVTEGEKIVTHGNMLLDAESQMKDSGGMSLSDHQAEAETTAPSESAPPPAHPLDPLLNTIAAVGAALAADDLEGYKTAIQGLHAPLPRLAEQESQDVAVALGKVDKARHLGATESDLAAARAAYLPLSEAAAELALALQAGGSGGGGIEVFACPMTDSAFPGAPAKARWVQAGGPTRNPWFGAEMLECGAKINP